MEELLIVIFQIFFEIVAYFPWDLFLYWGPPSNDRSTEARPFYLGLVGMALGGSLGWLSLLVLPDVIAKWPWLRITLLVVSPLVSGLAAYGMATLRRRANPGVQPFLHFWWSWAFTLGLVVVRFTFAIRPGH